MKLSLIVYLQAIAENLGNIKKKIVFLIIS